MSHSHSHNHNHSQIPNVAEVIAPVPTLRLGTLLRQKREVLGLGQREAAVMSLVARTS